jgi:hypothetical protein
VARRTRARRPTCGQVDGAHPVQLPAAAQPAPVVPDDQLPEGARVGQAAQQEDVQLARLEQPPRLLVPVRRDAAAAAAPVGLLLLLLQVLGPQPLRLQRGALACSSSSSAGAGDS